MPHVCASRTIGVASFLPPLRVCVCVPSSVGEIEGVSRHGFRSGERKILNTCAILNALSDGLCQHSSVS